MAYDSPTEDVRPTRFHPAIAAPKSVRLATRFIALAAVCALIVFVGPVEALHAAPPQSPRTAASTPASKNSNQPGKPLVSPNAAPAANGSAPAPYRAVLNQYCVLCHNEQLHTAGLVLSKLDVANVSEAAETWEKVIGKLRTGAMPPVGMPRPDKATYDGFATYLESALDQSALAAPNPGRVVVHRLNRAEYTNAVRDLLAVDVDVESLLPVDDSGYGFDNIADVLSVSPMLLVRYLSAAGKVTRQAVGDPNVLPNLETYDLPYLLPQDQRMSEDLPFGSRGGVAIRHNFPLDGEYLIKIRLQRAGIEHDRQIIGLSEPHQLDVRVDGERIKLFTVGGQPSGKDASGPQSTGPAKKAFGYDFRTDSSDANLEVRFAAKAGKRAVGVNFVNDSWEREGVLDSPLAEFRLLDKSSEGRSDSPGTEEDAPAVAQVSISGPYNPKGLSETPSRRKVFICRPINSADELACANKILSALARSAYRRPVTAGDLQPLLNLYKVGRKDGDFEAGVALALQRILVSPEFLFRIEGDPASVVPGTAYRISDIELASRLSFFLWSTLPDQQLLNLAAAGKLRAPAVLQQQVRRMLADPRSNELVTNFFGQWLYLRNMPGVHPDQDAFPEFDESLRAAFQQETQLFLQSNLLEDRSVLDLLNADYTFVNERLARFYGLPNVYGSHFRRVSLAGHEERRGLLGQGSILTVTSYANRTSPTIRGKWLLTNVLGTPPPPPPPDVPSLKETQPNGKVLTMRERMEQHRSNAACAVCHAQMDPLGFALENFNGVGEWRTTSEAGSPVDASGVLPNGVKFNGPVELRNVLLSHPEQFAHTVTERLLTYALGRGVEYYDQPAIRKITREAASDNYRWSSIILGIVNSVPFQMRMTKPKEPPIVRTAQSENQAAREPKP